MVKNGSKLGGSSTFWPLMGTFQGSWKASKSGNLPTNWAQKLPWLGAKSGFYRGVRFHRPPKKPASWDPIPLGHKKWPKLREKSTKKSTFGPRIPSGTQNLVPGAKIGKNWPKKSKFGRF